MMDKLSFKCAHCNHIIVVPSQFIGKQGICPKCKKLIAIPSWENSFVASIAVPFYTIAANLLGGMLGGVAYSPFGLTAPFGANIFQCLIAGFVVGGILGMINAALVLVGLRNKILVTCTTVLFFVSGFILTMMLLDIICTFD